MSARELEVLWKEIKDKHPRGADALRCRRDYFDALITQIPKREPERPACVGWIGHAFGIEIYACDGMPKGTLAQFISRPEKPGELPKIMLSVMENETP